MCVGVCAFARVNTTEELPHQLRHATKRIYMQHDGVSSRFPETNARRWSTRTRKTTVKVDRYKTNVPVGEVRVHRRNRRCMPINCLLEALNCRRELRDGFLKCGNIRHECGLCAEIDACEK